MKRALAMALIIIIEAGIDRFGCVQCSMFYVNAYGLGGEMRLPSKSGRSAASLYLSPRRSHGVVVEVDHFHGSLWRFSPCLLVLFGFLALVSDVDYCGLTVTLKSFVELEEVGRRGECPKLGISVVARIKLGACLTILLPTELK